MRQWTYSFTYNLIAYCYSSPSIKLFFMFSEICKEYREYSLKELYLDHRSGRACESAHIYLISIFCCFLMGFITNTPLP